jgi:uncharacterized protein with NAD-binding domain and iron-sulfur cluster
LIALAEAQIKRFFPEARRQSPSHAFVVREHDATISHPVGTTRLRPSSRTRFDNFFLAGDWTATGLPATIEGAVQSGQDCARMVLERSMIENQPPRRQERQEKVREKATGDRNR